jgi:hypothetical protein
MKRYCVKVKVDSWIGKLPKTYWVDANSEEEAKSKAITQASGEHSGADVEIVEVLEKGDES